MNPPLWRRARVFGQSGRYGGWLLAAYVICLFWIGAGIEEYVRLADRDGGRPYPLWLAPLVGLFTWPIDVLLAAAALGAWWLFVARKLPASEEPPPFRRRPRRAERHGPRRPPRPRRGNRRKDGRQKPSGRRHDA
jgi:hypothetical protein